MPFVPPKKKFIVDASPISINKCVLFCICKIQWKTRLSSNSTSMYHFPKIIFAGAKNVLWNLTTDQENSWMSEAPDSKIFSGNWNTFAALSIFNLVSDISRESKLTNKAERVMQANSSQSGFFTQVTNCLSSKSQTTAKINDVLGGWPRWMRKSGLLDCVCKYCKYWDQTETCQTGAPRQGQPDIYLANCCWRPSLAHTTILIIHNCLEL